MKCRAFSLIELLIVISIIALLMAIVAPSMLNTKQRAKAVFCQSNLRELSISLLMYELDNETFPSGYIFVPNYPDALGNKCFDRIGLWWINYISDYSRRDERKKNIFKCPSKNINDLNFENYVFYGNYGVNQSICKNSPNTRRVNEFLGKPLSSSNIKNPSGTLLITDSGYSLITWRHASDKDSESLGPVYEDTGYGEDTAYIPGLKINFDRIGKSLFFGQEEDAVNGRHPKKTVNVGFVDGHVESKKADDLLVESTPAGYKNRSELWQGN